jgi:histone deacetylase 1/2
MQRSPSTPPDSPRIADSPLIGDNDSSADSFGSSVPVIPAPPPVFGVQTRLQKGIKHPIFFTDGTVRYAFLTTTGEPKKLSEALTDENWKRAMQYEYDALVANNTWHSVPPNSNKNIIDCKWVYGIKRNVDGIVDRGMA